MGLFERYSSNPEDRTLRREVAAHVRRILHELVPALGPSYSHEGVGIGKSAEGAFYIHVKLRHRTKTLHTDLDLVFDGFQPEGWPTHGPLGVAFRVDAHAGGTKTKGYVTALQISGPGRSRFSGTIRASRHPRFAAARAFSASIRTAIARRAVG